MKRIIPAILFLALLLAPIGPMFAKTHDYPMRVQVIRSRWHGHRGWYDGFGHANLIAQQPGHPPKQGMDFEFSCGSAIRHTYAPDTYPARYGKNQYEVVVLLPVLGTDKGTECKMKIEMKAFVYRGRGNQLLAVPLTGGPPTPVQEDGGDSN
jgi:hypothetical protein